MFRSIFMTSLLLIPAVATYAADSPYRPLRGMTRLLASNDSVVIAGVSLNDSSKIVVDFGGASQKLFSPELGYIQSIALDEANRLAVASDECGIATIDVQTGATIAMKTRNEDDCEFQYVELLTMTNSGQPVTAEVVYDNSAVQYKLNVYFWNSSTAPLKATLNFDDSAYPSIYGARHPRVNLDGSISFFVETSQGSRRLYRMITVKSDGTAKFETAPEFSVEGSASISFPVGSKFADILFDGKGYKNQGGTFSEGALAALRIKGGKNLFIGDANNRGDIVGSYATKSKPTESRLFIKPAGAAAFDFGCMNPNSDRWFNSSTEDLNNSASIVISQTSKGGNSRYAVLDLTKIRSVKNYCSRLTVDIVGDCDKYFETRDGVVKQTHTFPDGKPRLCTVRAKLTNDSGSPLAGKTLIVRAGSGTDAEVQSSKRTDKNGIAEMRVKFDKDFARNLDVTFWRDRTYQTQKVSIELKDLNY